MSEGPQSNKGMKCMKNNPKVKGKKNENIHVEMTNHFEMFIAKSQDKRDVKK